MKGDSRLRVSPALKDLKVSALTFKRPWSSLLTTFDPLIFAIAVAAQATTGDTLLVSRRIDKEFGSPFPIVMKSYLNNG